MTMPQRVYLRFPFAAAIAAGLVFAPATVETTREWFLKSDKEYMQSMRSLSAAGEVNDSK